MYGIFSYDIGSPRVGYKHGQQILDLEIVGLLGFFKDLGFDPAVFARPALNQFIALGKPIWQAVGERIRHLLSDDESALNDVRAQVLIHEDRARLHLPVRIGDYTDFYAGIYHAENVGRMFRPNGEPLLPNYRHLPVAYHGRASSIVVSGTPIRRPSGQMSGVDGQPVFGPSQALDFELEVGLIIGKSNPLGEPVPIAEAEDYIFGITLFNDWSARDIQRWEYQPLGPFLGKNFGSSLSAWVVPLIDLEPFRVAGPVQEPTPLPYLQTARDGHFDLQVEVALRPLDGDEMIISRTNTRHLYWSFAQMVAHHTVNGCNLNIGDVLATGTISGPDPGGYGSLLELSWNGNRPLRLSDGSQRTFLQDGDTVTLRGWGNKNGVRIDLDEVTGSILPVFRPAKHPQAIQ
ncbi:fumarylacetoacetase [Spirosoma montaniterrae]|uniref:fumarylacetoacetase n=1 Tax=Spirosoma montaniterrae TaxID=1178516 RepID=A0A1P9WRN7_9BACT|nr:fumarylacetoacetase [Spirosoma montaniterrae]AQG78031.1 fumarylacetoacetase [Spirosoma montaniterrae]